MNNKIKTTQTILFALLIAAMILPFSAMQTAEAKSDKIGKDIVKQQASFNAMPEISDIKEKLKQEGKSESDIANMDLNQKYIEENQRWVLEHKNDAVEEIVRVQQDILTDELIENYQSIDSTAKNYFPWTSIGYDYESNALEVTLDPTEFNNIDIDEYQKIIRTIVGKNIDVTISPMDAAELTSCNSRTDCSDLKSGVEIGMVGKDFPCTLGFAALYQGNTGFVTAGHCFDGLARGTDALHPKSGSHIGDLISEHANRGTSTHCDCAFVESTGNISSQTYGMDNVSSIGSTVQGKALKSSMSQSGIKTGVVKDTYRNINIGGYHYIGVVQVGISVAPGDSGAAVFSDDGSELVGFLVASFGSHNSFYVKESQFRSYFYHLSWDF